MYEWHCAHGWDLLERELIALLWFQGWETSRPQEWNSRWASVGSHWLSFPLCSKEGINSYQSSKCHENSFPWGTDVCFSPHRQCNICILPFLLWQPGSSELILGSFYETLIAKVWLIKSLTFGDWTQSPHPLPSVVVGGWGWKPSDHLTGFSGNQHPPSWSSVRPPHLPPN